MNQFGCGINQFSCVTLINLAVWHESIRLCGIYQSSCVVLINLAKWHESIWLCGIYQSRLCGINQFGCVA
jgi:hypothetical protein